MRALVLVTLIAGLFWWANAQPVEKMSESPDFSQFEKFVRMCFETNHENFMRDDPFCKDFAEEHPNSKTLVMDIMNKKECEFDHHEEEGEEAEGDLIPGDYKWINKEQDDDDDDDDDDDEKRKRKYYKRNIVIPAYRWPHGIVYYKIDPSLDKAVLVRFEEAIKMWEEATCLRFQTPPPAGKHYVLVENGPGCAATVGYASKKTPQVVKLNTRCPTGTIVHEMGHTVGLQHEHTRTDRDDFIQINMDKIKDKYHKDFTKTDERLFKTEGFSYDYGSIMHYPDDAFRKKNTTGPTIQKKKLSEAMMGQRKEFSIKDRIRIGKMYECHLPARRNRPLSLLTKAQSIELKKEDGVTAVGAVVNAAASKTGAKKATAAAQKRTKGNQKRK